MYCSTVLPVLQPKTTGRCDTLLTVATYLVQLFHSPTLTYEKQANKGLSELAKKKNTHTHNFFVLHQKWARGAPKKENPIAFTKPLDVHTESSALKHTHMRLARASVLRPLEDKKISYMTTENDPSDSIYKGHLDIRQEGVIYYPLALL